MQPQTATGLWDYILFWLFTGSGLLGLPPAERDPALVKAVPPDTAIYFEWSARGEGQPGAAGIEGFAADVEVRQLLDAMKAQLLLPNGSAPPNVDRKEELTQLVCTVTAYPGCIFLGYEVPPDLKPGIGAWLEKLKGLHGGAIFSTGKDTDTVWNQFVRFFSSRPDFVYDDKSPTQSIPSSLPGYQFVMHREGERILFALGESTLPRVLNGLSGNIPGLDSNTRFQQAFNRVAVPRVSAIGWVDGRAIISHIVQAMGPLGMVMKPVFTMTGIDALDHAVKVSGVDNGTMIVRSFAATGGRKNGVMVLTAGPPLQVAHLSHIPGDADMVFAASLSLKNVYQEARRTLATAQPLSVRVFDEAIKQVESDLQLKIVDDVLPAFGDVVTAFDSPSTGGLVASSLILSLEVRDPNKINHVYDRLMNLLSQSLTPQDGSLPKNTLRQQQFAGRTLHYIHPEERKTGIAAGIIPTFCLTERHLHIAVNPQAMKAYLRLQQVGYASFDPRMHTDRPVPEGDLLLYSYLNGQRAGSLMSAVLPYVSTGLMNRLDEAGAAFDPFLIPSAAAIAPYFGDSRTYVVRQQDGIVAESHNLPPALVYAAILGSWRTLHAHDQEMLEEARRQQAAIDAGGPADGVKAAVATGAAPQQPSSAGKIAPIFLKALLPDNVQVLIPESAMKRLEEGPTPEQLEQQRLRQEEMRRRRDDRRRRRFPQAPPVPANPN